MPHHCTGKQGKISINDQRKHHFDYWKPIGIRGRKILNCIYLNTNKGKFQETNKTF